MIQVKEPKILNKLFNNKDLNNLKELFKHIKIFGNFDVSFSRWTASDDEVPQLKIYASQLTDLARNTFDSKTLLPTYALFAHYEGENARLHKHKDDNACTYTIDMCVYQKYPWDLYVEDNPYTLYPNDALAYYGNDQLHWREDFPEPKSNHVAMIFFHFAEPDHWWFTKGKEYLIDVIRNPNK